MDVSRIGGQNYSVTNSLRSDKSAAERLLGAKTSKMPFARESIEDNFLNRAETTTPSVEVEFNFIEAIKSSRKTAVDSATGERKKDLEMRMYWGEYNDIFSGGSPNGWGKLDMETMYSQAADIYKQIEESSDSEETKALKFKALENALSTGTGMYKMRVVGEKMKADALEAEAQGKSIDRTYRSKAKFDKLSAISKGFHNVTATFLNNLKSGKAESFDYNAMLSEITNKIMSYRHPS